MVNEVSEYAGIMERLETNFYSLQEHIRGISKGLLIIGLVFLGSVVASILLPIETVKISIFAIAFLPGGIYSIIEECKLHREKCKFLRKYAKKYEERREL